MSLCRSCGADIKWIELSSGKKMPVDSEAVSWDEAEEGMALVSEDGDVQKSAGNLIDDDRLWYVSHFATCPQANKWRKEKRRTLADKRKDARKLITLKQGKK